MTAPRRARLGRYALWQLRDYMLERGAPTVIVTMLFGFIGAGPMVAAARQGITMGQRAAVAKYGSLEAAQAAMLHGMSVAFLRSFLGAIVFLAALMAMNGIVANDRKLGYYRFLFSKPMSPPRYYGQAFAVNSAGYLALVAAMALVYGALVTPVLTPGFMLGIATVFLFYSAIAFLLSAAARWDWLSLVAVTVAATVLWERYGHSESPLAKLLYLLPPVHRTNEVYAAVAEGVALPSQTLLWLGGYGAACLVAGLLVLRVRRLAIL